MSVVSAEQPGIKRRLMTSRLAFALAVFAVAATLSSGGAGYMLMRQADERHADEHRATLLAAIDDLNRRGGRPGEFDAATLERLERVTGIRELRFESEPASVATARELHSVLDAQGRIVGWLSWRAHRSMGEVAGNLSPLLALTAALLLGFAGIALWLLRGTLRDLESSERRAWRLAHEDLLTGLPNHRKLAGMMDEALAARAPGELVTLALLDIDGLNEVNEIHGQQAGDVLLAAWAARLAGELGEGAACGRADGDQFAVLMTGIDAEVAQVSVRAITSAMERPFWIGDRAVQVGSTVGVAHAPLHAGARDDLIRRAELALRAAKRRNRGGMAVFEPSMDIEIAERRFIERELKRALADNALDVHYQPIVAAEGGRIVGAEALLRWNHRERGAIPPATFVAVAEQSGLMGRLGEFVLRRALADAARWPDIYIAVNLSPVQVRDPSLVALVSSVLAESGVPAQRLMLEVTEGVLIDNPDEAKTRLDALRTLGLRLALDDFGTGYSSLTYLQRFRFDKLKIDKGFVAPLGSSADSQAIVQGIVGLGRALGLRMLAEGVETEEQRVLLRLAGCEEMQGYLFARPAPRAEIDRLLAGMGAEARPLRRTG